MLPICYICLRHNQKLQSVNEDLENFYDSLCDYYAENFVQFCAECIYNLKKCYDFQKRCQIAVKKLNGWKKQKSSVKKSIKHLYAEVPASQLSYCNQNNFKIYSYQEAQSDKTPVISDSKPHIFTISIPEDTGTCDPEDIGLKNENGVKIEVMDITENKHHTNVAESEMWVDEDSQSFNDLKDDFEIDRNNDGQSASDSQSDSDTSLDELLSKFRTEKTMELDAKNCNVKKKRITAKQPFNKEELRKLLRKKFENNGIVMDDKGTVIDMERVLSSLDKSPLKMLKNIRNICSDPGPFKPAAVQKLSELQARYSRFESVFSTVYLSEVSQIWEEFERRRQYIDYTSSQYRCESCIRGFKHQKSLEHHNKTYHDESAGSFLCKFCEMRFRTKPALNLHTSTHSVVHRCKLCHFVTNHRSAMIKHYQQHNGVKYPCKFCGKEFKTESVMYAHCNSAHEPRHTCEFCARTFHKTKGLISHKHLKHYGEEFIENEENKKCDECDVLFISEDVYQKHMFISHRDVSHGREEKESEMKRRRYTTRKISCRLCKSEGYSPGWLVRHFLTDHPTEDMAQIYSSNKNYLCHDCGKGFNNARDFNDHRNTHTGVKPYACTKCPKKFHRKMTLRAHQERHLPPSRECPHCGKMFVTASYLASHMRIHINDRRYKCEICGKGFLYPATLREHINGVHFNIRRKKKAACTE